MAQPWTEHFCGLQRRPRIRSPPPPELLCRARRLGGGLNEVGTGWSVDEGTWAPTVFLIDRSRYRSDSLLALAFWFSYFSHSVQFLHFFLSLGFLQKALGLCSLVSLSA